MKRFLIDMVNSPEIANLILYYESLIEDKGVGDDEIMFIREFKEKYGDDVSYLYDFVDVENRMVGNMNSIHNKELPDFTEKNMTQILREEGILDRILFINDDIKDSKDEIIPETEYAKYWPERKQYLDNILKKMNQTDESKSEPDLSDLMKKGQGTYDPRQEKWLSIYNDIDPIDKLRGQIMKEKRSKYATATKQGEYAIAAAKKAREAIDFRKRPKARLFDNLKKGQPLQRPPIIPRGMRTLDNRLQWKLPGTIRDKYKDYYMTNQYRSAARDRWGENYLEDAPQEFLDAVDLEGTKDERLKAYKEAFQKIDLDEGKLLNEDELLDEFVNTIRDIESRGKKGEEVRLVVEDKDGNPQLDSGDQEGSQKTYRPSKKIPLEKDYGEIEEIKTICWFCNNKATHNLKYTNKSPTTDGLEIELGFESTYKPVCKKCYTKKNLSYLTN